MLEIVVFVAFPRGPRPRDFVGSATGSGGCVGSSTTASTAASMIDDCGGGGGGGVVVDVVVVAVMVTGGDAIASSDVSSSGPVGSVVGCSGSETIGTAAAVVAPPRRDEPVVPRRRVAPAAVTSAPIVRCSRVGSVSSMTGGAAVVGAPASSSIGDGATGGGPAATGAPRGGAVNVDRRVVSSALEPGK
jgi:hypothetical protein